METQTAVTSAQFKKRLNEEYTQMLLKRCVDYEMRVRELEAQLKTQMQNDRNLDQEMISLKLQIAQYHEIEDRKALQRRIIHDELDVLCKMLKDETDSCSKNEPPFKNDLLDKFEEMKSILKEKHDPQTTTVGTPKFNFDMNFTENQMEPPVARSTANINVCLDQEFSERKSQCRRLILSNYMPLRTKMAPSAHNEKLPKSSSLPSFKKYIGYNNANKDTDSATTSSSERNNSFWKGVFFCSRNSMDLSTVSNGIPEVTDHNITVNTPFLLDKNTSCIFNTPKTKKEKKSRFDTVIESSPNLTQSNGWIGIGGTRSFDSSDCKTGFTLQKEHSNNNRAIVAPADSEMDECDITEVSALSSYSSVMCRPASATSLLKVHSSQIRREILPVHNAAFQDLKACILAQNM